MTTALVTGSNRGIGLTIAEGLSTRGIQVLRASRDGANGPMLDVTDPAAIARVAKEITALDILVNNAGIALDGFDAEVARKTIDANFYGAMHLTDALLPALQNNARVVMVSSGLGSITALSDALQKRLLAPSLGRDELLEVVESFVSAVKNGDHTARGFPSSAYRVSKIAMNALTRILARELADDPRKIMVNAYDPGWVRSRMGGAGASRSLEQGARTGIFLATLPPGGPTGGFFRDDKAAAW